MTIIIACKDCGCQDLGIDGNGNMWCPSCGTRQLFQTYPVYLVKLIRKEQPNGKEEEPREEPVH